MYRFAIFQQDNTQVLLYLGNVSPSSDAAITLYFFPQWIVNDRFDPFQLNNGPISPFACR